MNKFKIDKVRIVNFRGFKDETILEFDNDCNAIIISGMNGIGKTSLYDAIEWLFTGELVRYSDSSEERNCKFIRFQPSDNDEITEVSAIIKNGIDSFIVTRELTDQTSNVSDYGSGKTKLKIIDNLGKEIFGEDASKFIDKMLINEAWQGKIKFSDVFGQYHLLSQDKIKYFVQGIKMPERYEYFANLLGNDRYLKVIPDLKKKIEDIRNQNKNIDKDINDIKISLSKLENIDITEKSFNIYDIRDLHSKILEYIDILNSYSNLFNIDIRLYCEFISLDSIKNILENISSLYSNIELKKNKYKDSLNKLIELEYGYETYKENLKQSKRLESLIDIDNKLSKLEYMQENLESYLDFERRKVEKINKQNKVKEEIALYEGQIRATKSIYGNINAFVENVITKYKDKSNIDNIIVDITNDRLSFIHDEFFINMKDEKLEVSKSLEYEEMSFLEINYNKFKNDILGKLNDLRLEHIRLSELNIKNKEDEKNTKNNIKNMSDMETSVKAILTDAKDYISKVNGNECPVCEREIDSIEIIERIKMKLDTPNSYIEDETIKLKNIQKEKIEITELMGGCCTESKIVLDEYVEYIDQILNAIQEKEIGIRSNYILAKTDYENIVDELRDLEEKNHKYIQLIRELEIQTKNIKLEISDKIDCLDKEIKYLDYDYENYNIDDVIKNKDKIDLSISVYRNKLRKEDIDKINIEACIKDRIKLEEKILTKTDKSLSDIELIKNKINSINTNLKLSDDYKKWEKNNKELERLEVLRERNSNKISDIEEVNYKISKVVSILNKEVMDDNKSIINSIFKKIFPNPYYRSIDFNFDMNSRNKNILKLECKHRDGKTTINPAYIFSSTQVNIISVSIFLGIAMKQTCTNLDLILLDDPIQNMDDMNVLSFIDVLRGCMNQDILNKQIILSTHDNKMASLFIKKFRFYKGKNYKFLEYSNSGPKIECKKFGGIK